MNNVVKMFLNLVIIGAVSGAILAGFYYVADPMIKDNQEKELKEAIFVVLPEAKDYKLIKKTVDKVDITIYEGIDEAGSPVGIAFKADGGGFQGNVGVMVGLNLDYLHRKGIKILDQVETPGLGNRISEPAFEGQFKGIDILPKVEYIKNRKPEKPNQIQSITGATISSNAVVVNINNAVAKVLSAFPKEEVERLEKDIVPASRASKEKKDGR